MGVRYGLLMIDSMANDSNQIPEPEPPDPTLRPINLHIPTLWIVNLVHIKNEKDGTLTSSAFETKQVS